MASSQILMGSSNVEVAASCLVPAQSRSSLGRLGWHRPCRLQGTHPGVRSEDTLGGTFRSMHLILPLQLPSGIRQVPKLEQTSVVTCLCSQFDWIMEPRPLEGKGLNKEERAYTEAWKPEGLESRPLTPRAVVSESDGLRCKYPRERPHFPAACESPSRDLKAWGYTTLFSALR